MGPPVTSFHPPLSNLVQRLAHLLRMEFSTVYFRDSERRPGVPARVTAFRLRRSSGFVVGTLGLFGSVASISGPAAPSECSLRKVAGKGFQGVLQRRCRNAYAV